jgi:hypothetical protein
MFHARSKYIKLNYHFMLEQVTFGLLITKHIFMIDQIVDLFIKSMSKATLSYFWTKLCPRTLQSLRKSISITTQHDILEQVEW